MSVFTESRIINDDDEFMFCSKFIKMFKESYKLQSILCQKGTKSHDE